MSLEQGSLPLLAAGPPYDQDEVDQLLTPPKRRKVKAMKELFSGLKPGTAIQAVIKDAVFGVYAIAGVARLSEIAGGFCLGSTILTLGVRPEKYVVSVSVLSLTGLPALELNSHNFVGYARHGHLVHATFQSRHTDEELRFVGFAVGARDSGMLGVGQWIIRQRGLYAPALTGITLLAGTLQTSLICPPLLRSWAELDDPVVTTQDS
ncbi:hypothetical protein [Tomitella biformata]|uniref:hypothetical protein n=1 Tax=Tomitella biformata TaxID=630403 RepID=UPI00046686A1|nr:hypothetical protein [Tomitella biformata]